MLLDTEFIFENYVGKYDILPFKKIIPACPKSAAETLWIRCRSEGCFKNVYNQYSTNDSIATSFANIPISDNEAILMFCN